MKSKLWIALAALALIAALTWAWMPKPVAVDVAALHSGHFERSVQEQGKTRLRARFTVSAPLAGSLSRMTLREGDTVAAGSVLATLTPTAPALLDARSLREQREREGAMEARMQQAGASIARAQVALAQARTDWQRSQTLAQQGFVSSTQTESGALTVQLREKDLEAARLEEHAARHELEQVRIALQRGNASAPGLWTVRAPAAGKVLKVLRDSESVVAAGTPLLELGDPGQLEVLADLLTEDAAQISPGAAAVLSQWGGPKDLQARVRSIEPAAFTKVSALGVEEQRVHVVLDITSPPDQWSRLGDGFKADVRIVVQTIDKTPLLPVSAVFPVGEGWAVYAVEQGRVREVPVTVLGRNGRDAAVRTDLPDGAEVVVYPPPTLQAGARVQVRSRATPGTPATPASTAPY